MSGEPKPPPHLDAAAIVPQEFVDNFEQDRDPSINGPLIAGYLPAQRIHLLGASPSAGKSTLVGQLTGALETGGKFVGLQCNKKKVRFVFTDRTASSCLETLEQLKLSPPYLSMVDCPELLEFERELIQKAKPLYGLKLFERALDLLGTPPGTVVISDVHTNAFLGNISFQPTLGAYMRHTAALCVKRQITLIMVCYGVKIVGDQAALYRRLIDRIIGAPSLRGSSDGLMYLTSPEEAGKTKKNGQPSNVQQFQLVARRAAPYNVNLINRNGLFVVESPEEGQARVLGMEGEVEKKPAACEAIYPYVPSGEPKSPAEIMEAFTLSTGRVVSPGTLNGWLKELESQDRIEKPRYGFWRRVES